MKQPFVIATTCPISERHQRAIQQAAPQADLRVYPSIAEAAQSLSAAEVLVTYGEDLTAEWMSRCESLKWIQVISAGLERMPFPEIQNKAIRVTNARGIHAAPISEYVMGMILQTAHRFLEFYELQRNRQWDRSVRIDEIGGKTLGVLGPGAIGSAIAEKAQVFGMRTIGMNTDGRPQAHFDQMAARTEMEQVISESDYLVISVPLTSATNRLIGAKELKLMKKTAWLINVARGDVIDEKALQAAIDSEQIAGAVLDVFQEEPLPPDQPFWSSSRVIVTPHISGRSSRYMERSMEIFLHNLKVYQEGKGDWRNPVDLEKGY